VLTGNTANTNNWYGFMLHSPGSNTMTGSIANNNNETGFYLWNSSYNTLASNTASTNGDDGFHLYSSSNSNTLTGNIANNNKRGFYLWNSSHNLLTDNTASTNNGTGFWLGSSSNSNTLTSNTASTNNGTGFELLESSDFNILTSNTANTNTISGFRLDHSKYNTLDSNAASTNRDGFRLYFSSHNTLSGNNASKNGLGFVLQDSSDFNTLTGNTASTNNGTGFLLFYSSINNLFYFNSILLNPIQASSDSANTWHNCTHGNYWSDYAGPDSNNDGIGDTPYSISGGANNEDPYPLLFDPVRNLYRPSAPQNLVATAGEGFVELTWTPPTVTGSTAITGYHIYRSTTNGSGYTQIGTSTTTAFTDTTVSNGVTYYYVVRAISSVGESPPSNEVTATPTAPVSSSENASRVSFSGFFFLIGFFSLSLSVRYIRRRKNN
jgi:parallel beta-helix repeat protein